MSTEDSPESDEPRHPYETDESFHPMGPEWEEQMREELEDTDYDADLGMEMARDAQRLVAGELSEEEFYAEYHDDVKEEFETDERPIFDDLEGIDLDDFEDQSMLESLADVDLSGDESSRREMMSKMGAAGLFLGYSAFATYDNEQDEEIPERVSGIQAPDEDEREHRWGMVIDLERCDGCLACVTGCIDENGTSTGANWMYVFTYEDEQSEQENFLVRPCQHCSNAPCEKVCPVRARHTRDKDGLVLTDYETCIGCRYCQVACPYGVNYFQWGEPDTDLSQIDHLEMRPEEVRELDFEERQERLREAGEMGDHVYDERGWWVDSRPPTGVMGKCTMCPSRQDEHTPEHGEKGTVACMDACDDQGMSAIHFGDLDDEDSRANKYLRRRVELSDQDRHSWEEEPDETEEEEEMRTTTTNWGRISSFKLLEEMNTQPNITYLGNEPGAEDEQVDPAVIADDPDRLNTPVSYEDLTGDDRWGNPVKDNRKEHLDYGAGGPPEEEA